MVIEKGTVINGFKAVRVRRVDELGGNFYEFVHEETGAELAWLDNGELNKLFCVAFKTLPEDSTGVFHILEHSVLCGSDKFPVKEPFVELMKSSMNTFLNAITFQDKTVYPVSSRNTRDFLNLTEVYLDAVFRPALLNNPNIFYQEGRHIEQAEDGTLSYKGVVFNEMKGALSRVDRLTGEKLEEMIFKGSPYGVNSGGDPAVIPDLTYEKFVATYKKFYHPSNSRIYLDGDIPVEETFALIESYLKGAGRGVRIPDAEPSEPISRRADIKYALSASESQKDRVMYSLGRIIGTWDEKVKMMAVAIVSEVLLGGNEAPLKREVLSSGLAKDIELYIDTSFPQPYIVIECTNVADGRENELKELIFKTGRKLAEAGIDREQLQASISHAEFVTRDREEPRALRRGTDGLLSWLHDGDPLLYMTYDNDFKELRALLGTGYYEEIAKEIFSTGDGLCEVCAHPDVNADNELREIEKERLEKIRKSWTDEDANANRLMNEALALWQKTPDSAENLATIPVLTLSEIDQEPVVPPTEELKKDGVTVLFHKVPCKGIVHFTMYADLSDFSLRDITVISRCGHFYGVLPTAKYDSLELQKKIRETAGRLYFAFTTNGRAGVTETTKPYFTVNCSVLERNLGEACELIREILENTDFSDKNKIKEIVIQNDERLKQWTVSSGHSLALSVASAGYSAADAVTEAVSGVTYVKYSHDFADKFDEYIGEFSECFEKLKKHFHQGRMMVSVSTDELPDISPIIGAFRENDETDKAQKGGAGFTKDFPSMVGCVIPAQIGFATQCYNFGRDGIKYDGTMSVAAKIASLDFMWNVIRVQGGAYGAGLFVTPANDIKTYSYRDPSPDRSLGENKKVGAFLREFAASGSSLDKYIISAIADSDPFASPRVMGIIADNNWFAGLGIEDARRFRREMLATNAEDIKRFADMLDRFAEEGAGCVVAYKDALDKCGDITVYDI